MAGRGTRQRVRPPPSRRLPRRRRARARQRRLRRAVLRRIRGELRHQAGDPGLPRAGTRRRGAGGDAARAGAPARHRRPRLRHRPVRAAWSRRGRGACRAATSRRRCSSWRSAAPSTTSSTRPSCSLTWKPTAPPSTSSSRPNALLLRRARGVANAARDALRSGRAARLHRRSCPRTTARAIACSLTAVMRTRGPTCEPVLDDAGLRVRQRIRCRRAAFGRRAPRARLARQRQPRLTAGQAESARITAKRSPCPRSRFRADPA